MNDRQRLEAIIGVVCKYLPPDGIPANEAMSQIIALVDPLPAPVQEPDRVRECAKRLVEHADFKLGGALSADSKAKDIPSNAISNVKARHLAALRDALEATPPAQPAAWVWLTDEERRKLFDPLHDAPFEFAKRIEAKLKEKNT